MGNRQLVDWIRALVAHLQGGGQFSDQIIDELERMQDQFSLTYSKYEEEETPPLALPLKNLMMEALQFLHDGLEDILEHEETAEAALLPRGLASVEEGNDILDSLRYAVEQDTSWTSSASMG